MWLQYAKRLQALASTGLHFGADDFDKERYGEIGNIAQAMLADLGGVPIERILFPEYGRQYASPQIDVRAAVFRDGKVLLVKERLDELWTLPGGYADVGLSAAENAVKEVLEEACVPVRAVKLYCVKHKAKHPYPVDARDFYKFFFLCEQLDAKAPGPGPETLAAEYVAVEALPQLSLGRTLAADIELAAVHLRQPELPTVFD